MAFRPIAYTPLSFCRSAHAPGESHGPPSDSGLSISEPEKLLVAVDEAATEKLM